MRGGVFLVVPRLEVRLVIVLREEETPPELCELLLSFLTETKQKLTIARRILDLVGFRHHKTRLGVDAGQDGVLGPRYGVLALSSQQDIPGLQTVQRLRWRFQVYEMRQVMMSTVSTVVLASAAILLLDHIVVAGAGRLGIRLHFDEASVKIIPQ